MLLGAGGKQLAVGSSLAATVSNAKPGLNIRFGNGGTYYAGSWQAYSGMWGVNVANNTNFIYTCDVAYSVPNFPQGTTFEWDTKPDYHYGGVEGYLALSFGNYDGNSSPTPIPSRQLKNITTLKQTVTWTKTGGTQSALLSECYVTTTTHPTGGISGADPVAEIAFFPGNSPNSTTFIQGVTSVGSYSDVNSVTWNVSQAGSGVGPIPYYIAYRPGYVDFNGDLDYKSLFTFLTTQGKLTGNEWFNGVAFGVEPFGLDAGMLSIDSISVSYA